MNCLSVQLQVIWIVLLISPIVAHTILTNPHGFIPLLSWNIVCFRFETHKRPSIKIFTCHQTSWILFSWFPGWVVWLFLFSSLYIHFFLGSILVGYDKTTGTTERCWPRIVNVIATFTKYILGRVNPETLEIEANDPVFLYLFRTSSSFC